MLDVEQDPRQSPWVALVHQHRATLKQVAVMFEREILRGRELNFRHMMRIKGNASQFNAQIDPRPRFRSRCELLTRLSTRVFAQSNAGGVILRPQPTEEHRNLVSSHAGEVELG